MVYDTTIEVYPDDEGWAFRFVANEIELARSSRSWPVAADARAIAEIVRRGFDATRVEVVPTRDDLSSSV
jgi:hypothetical protein